MQVESNDQRTMVEAFRKALPTKSSLLRSLVKDYLPNEPRLREHLSSDQINLITMWLKEERMRHHIKLAINIEFFDNASTHISLPYSNLLVITLQFRVH